MSWRKHFQVRTNFWNFLTVLLSTTSNILQKITKKRGAFQTLQGLAFSLLDQWFSSETKKANQRPRSNKVEENNSITEVSQTHPMRYLFLLGVLPTTFGSLYSLGYTPIRKFMYSVEITEIYSYTVLTKISRKQRFNYRTQCGNFMIFLSHRFYVKSILRILIVQKQPF